MRYRKLGLQLRNTEKGQAAWVLGLFGILFALVLVMFEMQIYQYRSTSQYLEDALAASGLASALIDVREYGESRRLVIKDMKRAYKVYWDTLKDNLALENGVPRNLSMISGDVKLDKYLIYNVEGDQVYETEMINGEIYAVRNGVKGEIKAPNGQVVEKTGVYSEISFPVKGFLGVSVMADKGKLIEVNGL